jgi:hypothetical protein
MENTALYILIFLLAAFVIYLYFKIEEQKTLSQVVISEAPMRYYGRGYNDVWFGPGRDHHSPRMIRHVGPGHHLRR